MKITAVLEYKLKGERNNRPRRPLVFSGKVLVIFVYDKKGFIESKIQCFDINDFALSFDAECPPLLETFPADVSLMALCGGLWTRRVRESNQNGRSIEDCSQ
jgi:hypothetical protein